ncbi:hypothetical protein [uncultured Tenacibaculum sp.]|uniref:hypothetical protein n=1 Tax=uncultured Tenacibaculum sp. TaxID=174713 RepID=UPI0026227235|nr:hypothetical protein [uncultured Tenacibaculum sp.]
MKNQILSLGKILKKPEQKLVLGGDKEQLPICKCNGVGQIINQPCEGYGPGCGVIDIDVCSVFPSLC